MSIVKELDKISGTDTRSKNIEDAVKKLELGGGAGGISIIDVELSIDGGDVDIASTNLPTYDEVVSMWESGAVIVKIDYGNGTTVLQDFLQYYSNLFSNTQGQYLVSVTRADGWSVIRNQQ